MRGIPGNITAAALILMASWAGAREVPVTVLHTTDIHGHMRPVTDYDGNQDVGGFLRCAREIRRIRAETSNTVLIDCGDSFQGSPESYLTDGRLIIDAYNHFGYDAWVIGNHEFDWGTGILRARHDQAEIPVLAANIYFLNPAQNWLPDIKPFVIREMDGIRIAIIGLTTPGIPSWSLPPLLDGALFADSVETLRRIMPEVRAAEPDIIIAAVHQGYKRGGDDHANQVEAIARAFPEIDLMLGGHSHQAVEEMYYGDVLFAQAGYHGIWLGQVDMLYDTVERKLISRKSRLHHMDATVPYDEMLLDRWREDLNRADERLAESAGELTQKLESGPDEKGVSSMQQFISAAIANRVDADFVLHGSLASEPVEPGTLSYRDVWQIVPYENTIGILSLTVPELRAVLEENFSRRLYHYSLGPYGFDFDLVRDGNRVEAVNLRLPDGTPLHARKRYRVAFNSYVLSSGGRRHLAVRELADKPEARLEMVPVDTRTAVAEFLKIPHPSEPEPAVSGR